MINAWLLAILGLAVCGAVEFEQRQHLQSSAITGGSDNDPDGYNDYNNNYYYYGGPTVHRDAEESARFHHGKHKKLKKLKKRLLLQCLLGGHGRRRRDATAASGRFLLPITLQSTNVNVGGGGYGNPQHQYSDSVGGGGCMEMFNGPSLGSGLGGLLGSSMEDAVTGAGSRGGVLYTADWNRYARQFHRNYVRPLYRLF